MPTKSKKAPHLSVATTASQIDAWTQAAALGGRSLSGWVRFTLDEAASDQLLEAEGPGEEGHAALRKRVNKLYRQVGQMVAELALEAPPSKGTPKAKGSR